MTRQQRYLRSGGGFFVLATMLLGCNNSPPVAETPPPPVTVSQPVLKEITDYGDYEGRIAAVEFVEVRARVRGELVKVCFKQGQTVEEGDPLFEIDPKPYQTALDAAKAQKASADASLELAKKEYARIAGLVRSNAASREELDVWSAKQLTARADQMKAEAEVTRANLDLNYCKVDAPIDGRTSKPNVTEGNLVNAGGGETLLTTITSVDPMYVEFDVDERALLHYREVYKAKLKVKEGAPEPAVKDLKIPVSVGLEGEKGYPHQGMLVFSDNRVNPSTGTILVRGELPNKDRKLSDGMRARVRVLIGDPHKVLMITERAIGNDQGRKFVYIVNDKNETVRREVTLGKVADGMQIILDGLTPEDQVIVNGIQRVREGVKVDPKKPETPSAAAEPAKSNTTK